MMAAEGFQVEANAAWPEMAVTPGLQASLTLSGAGDPKDTEFGHSGCCSGQVFWIALYGSLASVYWLESFVIEDGAPLVPVGIEGKELAVPKLGCQSVMTRNQICIYTCVWAACLLQLQ